MQGESFQVKSSVGFLIRGKHIRILASQMGARSGQREPLAFCGVLQPVSEATKNPAGSSGVSKGLYDNFS